MSQENVDLVTGAAEAFNARDFAALAEISDPDLVFTSALAAVDGEGGRYIGPDAWRDYFADMDEVWESWKVVDLQVFDAGEQGVASKFLLTGTGKHSGIRVEHATGIEYRVRNGKFHLVRSYMDPDDALRAVGMDP